jgi:hypothetical protein
MIYSEKPLLRASCQAVGRKGSKVQTPAKTLRYTSNAARSHSMETNTPRSKFLAWLRRYYTCHHDTVILQPRKIYQSEKEKNFKVDIDILTCVNGYLAHDRKQAASLIVFGVQLVTLKKGSFNRIKMDLDFLDANGMESASCPVILNHAPYKTEAYENVTQIKNTHKIVLNGNGNAGGPPGSLLKMGASLEVTDQRESNFKDRYYGKGSSSTRLNAQSSRSGIWWNVKKSSDPDAHDDAGIKANYQFAVLLTRPNNDLFRAKLTLLVDAGWRFKTEIQIPQKVKDNKGASSTSLVFSPEVWYEGTRLLGIERTRLGEFVKSDTLVKLAETRR